MNSRFTHLFLCVCMVAVAPAIGCNRGDGSKETASTPATTRDSTTTASISAYRAFGNEPFWSVAVDANGLRFTSPEDSTGISFPPVEPVAVGDTLRWTSTGDHGAIIVRIWGAPCSDGMSDRTWQLSSAVQLNETTYLGCAEVSSQSIR